VLLILHYKLLSFIVVFALVLVVVFALVLVVVFALVLVAVFALVLVAVFALVLSFLHWYCRFWTGIVVFALVFGK
jgi:hypothetical protein